MNENLEKIENSEAYLEFEIDVKTFAAAWKKSYQKNAKKYALPGFRRGRASQAALEAKFGTHIFLEDAIDEVVPDQYYTAIKALGIEAIGEPDIEIGYIEKDKPVIVKACVPVKPEVILGALEGLEIQIPEADNITDEAVEKHLQAMRRKNKLILEKLHEEATEGDTVTFDYQCYLDGALLEKRKDFKLLLGKDSFYPDFDNHLIGVKAGESLKILLHFSEEDTVEQLAGKSVFFKVKVKKVENISLRELDDGFAREIGKAENMESLRIKARALLEETAEWQMIERKRQAAVKGFLERCEVVLPDAVVMQRARLMLEQFSKMLSDQGKSVDLYLQANHLDEVAFKKQLWEDAKLALKSDYVLEKIIETRGLGKLGEEELRQGLEDFAASIGMERENAGQNLGPLAEKVKFDLKAAKAAQYLVDHTLWH